MTNLQNELLSLKELQDIKFVLSFTKLSLVNDLIQQYQGKIIAVSRYADEYGNTTVEYHLGLTYTPPAETQELLLRWQ